jgi:predicted amidophosphoribosyltransferase
VRGPDVPAGWTPPGPAAVLSGSARRGPAPPGSAAPAGGTGRRWLPVIGTAVLDLVLPEDCAACGGSGGPLCRLCAAALPTAGALARAAGALPGLPPVIAAGPYDGALRAVLLAHKDGSTGLVRALGPVIAGAVLAGAGLRGAGLTGAGLTGAWLTGAGLGDSVPPGAGLVAPASDDRTSARAAGAARPAVLLVPVPSSSRAVRERGHDHALRLARRAAAELRRRGCRARALAALRQSRGVDDQGALTAEARAVNLTGAVSVRRRALRELAAVRRAGVPVVLVDDVCASGATLAECGRALSAAGYEAVLAAVAAATVLRSPTAGVALVPARPGVLPTSPAAVVAPRPGPGPARPGRLARPPRSRAPLPTRGPED